MLSYFLTKTDPDTFSIKDFAKEKTTTWDGVHNYQAIAVIKQWKVGDFVLIYHSIKDKCLVGLAKAITQPVQNQNDPRTSWIADLELIQIFTDEQKITLIEIKSSGLFTSFDLVKNSRLSVMSCPDNFIDWLKDKGLGV